VLLTASKRTARHFANQAAMRLFDIAVVAAVFAQAPASAPTPVAPAPSPSASAAPGSSYLITAPQASSVPSTPPVLPLCATAKITPIDSISSKNANPGQTFRFAVASVDDPQKLHANVAATTQGLGLVAVVRRARTGGDPGLLVLEARYVVATDGTHVPVSMMRSVNGLYMGKTGNSPPLLGLIPYVGYVTGTYDALHKGGEVSAGPADSLIVLVGDDAISGGCTPPSPPPPGAKPTETPAPTPSPAATPSATPRAAPTAP